MSNKLISAIIPAYNAEKTIQKAIRSIIDQDYPCIELIVVDDGSKDKTIHKVWEMRKECNAKGIKIHLIAQRNAGVSVARNRAVAESNGEYIAFLDADDQWLPTKLSEHSQHLDKNKYLGLSFARVNFINAERVIRKPSVFTPSIDIEDCMAVNPTISPSNWVVRKSVFVKIGGFNITMTHAEDQEFLIRLLQKTDLQIEGLDKVLVNYMTSIDGLSSNIDAMYKGWLKLMDELSMSKLEESNNSQTSVQKYNYHQLRHQYCLFLSRRCMQTKQSPIRAWGFYFKSLLSNPVSLLKRPLEPIRLGGNVCFYTVSVCMKKIRKKSILTYWFKDRSLNDNQSQEANNA